MKTLFCAAAIAAPAVLLPAGGVRANTMQFTGATTSPGVSTYTEAGVTATADWGNDLRQLPDGVIRLGADPYNGDAYPDTMTLAKVDGSEGYRFTATGSPSVTLVSIDVLYLQGSLSIRSLKGGNLPITAPGHYTFLTGNVFNDIYWWDVDRFQINVLGDPGSVAVIDNIAFAPSSVAAPIPAAAPAGLLLLGGIGLRRFRRPA